MNYATSIVLALAAIVATPAAASGLDDQMAKVVMLEHLDAWCATGEHDIDLDKLRARTSHEIDKAVAAGASEKETRAAYAYAEWVFSVRQRVPELFCENVYRARLRDPGLLALYRD
jgi:hypothetical protein